MKKRTLEQKISIYKTREAHLLGGAITLTLYTIWPIVGIMWLVLVFGLWLWSITHTNIP